MAIVSLASDFGGDLPRTALRFNPWLLAIEAVIDILVWTGLIPDPFQLLLSLFSGRPREEASLLQAQRLALARNPAARIAGIALQRMVNEWDIVTSETGSGRAILDAWANRFVTNLTAQGVALDRARQILVDATGEAAQSGLPLEPELRAPMPDQLVFNGPSEIRDALFQRYADGISKGLTIPNALQAAEKWVYKNIGLRFLFDLQIGDFIPTTPPDPKVLPTQDGSCPAGYTLDPTTRFCLLPPTNGGTTLGNGAGGGSGGGGTGGGGQSDPEGDEITNDLCAQLGGYTAAIIAALPGAATSTGGQPCCDNSDLVAAIGSVVTTLASILSVVGGTSGGGGAGVDLTQIVDALNGLVAAVGALAPSGGVDLSPIVTALDSIAAKIPAATGTDVSGIVDQLKQIVGQGDVDQAIFDALQQAGIISPADLQSLQGIKWSDALSYLTAGSPIRAVENFVKRVGADADTAKGDLAKLAVGVGIWAENELAGGIKATGNVLYPLITNVLDKIIRELQPPGPVSPGVIGVNPDVLLSQVAAVMLTLHVIATTVSLLREGAGEQISKTAEKITGLLGFEELREVQLGPLIRNGIAAVAEMNARLKYRQTLPGAGQVTNWHARGLMGQAQERADLAYQGYNDIFMPIMEQASYGGLQARMMVRAWDSGLFSQGDLADELTFRGMRPASQQRMLMLAPWLATVSERNQLRATLEKAYIQGLLADADLHAQIDQIQHDTDRDALILQRAQLEKRLAFAKDLEHAYAEEFRAGVITEPLYRSLLAGIGLQPDWINTRVAVDDAHLLSVLARQAAAAERALERATATEERRAAVKNFTNGNIDAAALLAALLLTGLTATQAAAWVDLASLQKAGGLRWIYGLQLPEAAAALLRARVAALSDQRKRNQITDLAFLSALQALGIPAHYINTIHAAVDAMITPKASAVVIPVGTS
jgi:hypothetical protein